MGVREGSVRMILCPIRCPRGPDVLPNLRNLPVALTEVKPRILLFERLVEFLPDAEAKLGLRVQLASSFRFFSIVS